MIYTASARTTALTTAGELNNPFVAWSNLGAAATLGGTTVLTGGEAANAVSGSTYDKWRPDVTATTAVLSFDFGSATVISFAALAAHNLSTYGGSVILQKSTDGVSWSSAGVGTITPTDNSAIAMRADTAGTAKRYWRFYFTGLTAGDLLSVGVAFLGNDLIFPRRFYQGFAPPITPTEVQLQSNVSVGGHPMGSSVITRGTKISASVRNVPESFIRGADWIDFQTQFGEGKPFFFAWRPTTYAQDVWYAWRDGGVIQPTNSGPRDFMSVEMAMRAYNG